MAASQNEEIITLARDIIDDSELSRTSVEALVLKASRLARLIGDVEAETWLWHERFGYNDSDDVCKKYLLLTSRWIDQENGKAYFASIGVQESSLLASKERLDITKKFTPSGQWASHQFFEQKNDALKLSGDILLTQRIVSSVRGQVHLFALRVYHERVFSTQAENIFAQYQSAVDALLAQKAGTAFDRLPHAFERLSVGEAEAISHALTTCRRVIDSFADAVFPARDELFKIGEEPMKVSPKEVKNRLLAYIYDRIGKNSRYDRLKQTIMNLYARVSAGVHADVDVGEARAIVLQTYLLLGELLHLPLPS